MKTRSTGWRRWLAARVPPPPTADLRQRLRAVLGAAVGLLACGLAGRWAGGAGLGPVPWLVAPLGASAVLVFAVPSSPLAQPWSVIGGNTSSALWGMACVATIPDPTVAAAVAVAGAIALMFLLRCLHPPGGAAALLAVLVHATDLRYATVSVLANSVILVLAGRAYHAATKGREARLPAAPPRTRFTAGDLDAALAHYNQVLDVSRADLQGLLHDAEAAAYRRTLGALRCEDIMSRHPVAVSRNSTVDQARHLMRQRGIKALPVIDRARHLVGIVTAADFVRDTAVDPALAVGEVMTRRVRVAGVHLHVIELLPLFSEGGHHHLPIVDDEQCLVGIVTQSDMVRALHRAVGAG